MKIIDMVAMDVRCNLILPIWKGERWNGIRWLPSTLVRAKNDTAQGTRYRARKG